MTIGKRLYAGFGLILVILAILFLVNIFTGYFEKSARTSAGMALDSVRTVEAVRYQIMLNRLNMNNFLLSGDPRDEDKVNKGLTDMADLIKRGEAQSTNDAVHTALIQVESTEASWADNFAKPLIAKRHQVDTGDATVSDLQIFYLQKDPSSWLAKSKGPSASKKFGGPKRWRLRCPLDDAWQSKAWRNCRPSWLRCFRLG